MWTSHSYICISEKVLQRILLTTGLNFHRHFCSSEREDRCKYLNRLNISALDPASLGADLIFNSTREAPRITAELSHLGSGGKIYWMSCYRVSRESRREKGFILGFVAFEASELLFGIGFPAENIFPKILKFITVFSTLVKLTRPPYYWKLSKCKPLLNPHTKSKEDVCENKSLPAFNRGPGGWSFFQHAPYLSSGFWLLQSSQVRKSCCPLLVRCA